MKAYSELSKEELMELREQLLAAYEEKKALGLNLDMSRGKPSLLCLTLYQEHIHME